MDNRASSSSILPDWTNRHAVDGSDSFPQTLRMNSFSQSNPGVAESSRFASDGQRQKGKVDDALVYLEQVRHQFASTPHIYVSFLEIMKDFKSQTLDTQGVIRKVSELFTHHVDLITGFNTFLPVGYEVQISGNTLKIIEPNNVSEVALNIGSRIAGDTIDEDMNEPIDATDPQALSPKVADPLRLEILFDSKNEETTLEQALEILNKIRQKYGDDTHVYQQFLSLLGAYHNSVEERPNLHTKIVQLFKDDRELLDEFRLFLPTVFSGISSAAWQETDSTKNIAAEASCNMLVKATLLTEKELAFFEKINCLKGVFQNKCALNSFYHALELYGNEQVSRIDLLTLLTPFFVHSPFLMQTLNEVLEDSEEKQNFHQTRLPIESRCEPATVMEIDYNTVRRLGQSYREQAPEKRTAICSGRLSKHRLVLNDDWMAHASWQSEDSAAVSSKKTVFEEILWRIEDERFDYDICESIVESSKGILSQINMKMSLMGPSERRKFKLDSTYGYPNQPTLIPRCIKRVYGEHSSKILLSLKESPEESVPCVLRRLDLTLENMKKEKAVHNERWSEQSRFCVGRSLDNQSSFFRNSDSKFLRCRSLIQDVEKVYEKRAKLVDNGFAETILPPLVVLTYPEDTSVLFDANYLIECSALASHLTSDEMSRVRFILKFLLPVFFCVSPAHAADGLPGDNIASRGIADYLRFFYSKNVSELISSVGKNLHSTRTNCSYYGNQHWTLFLRSHHILCERLNRIKDLCRRRLIDNEYDVLSERQKDEYYCRHGFRGDLRMWNAGKGNADEQSARYYDDVLDLVRILIDGNLEQSAYEDVVRCLFGVDAFHLYTMDRLLSIVTRYLIAIVQDPQCSITLNLFKSHITKELNSDTQRFSNDEIYEFMSAVVLYDCTCIKSTTVMTDRPTVTLEVIDAPTVPGWYKMYTGICRNVDPSGRKPIRATLTFLDDARAIIPRWKTSAFLRRNLRRGAQRLRSFATLGDTIFEIFEEAHSSSTAQERDSQLEDDEMTADEDDAEYDHNIHCDSPRSETSMPSAEFHQVQRPQIHDRKTTSFIKYEGCHTVVLNSSYGPLSSHRGNLSVLLRRGAPYRSLGNCAHNALKSHAGMLHLLKGAKRKVDDFSQFTKECLTVKFQHPANPAVAFLRYFSAIGPKTKLGQDETQMAEYARKHCDNRPNMRQLK